MDYTDALEVRIMQVKAMSLSELMTFNEVLAKRMGTHAPSYAFMLDLVSNEIATKTIERIQTSSK